jgi:hypothetical protein
MLNLLNKLNASKNNVISYFLITDEVTFFFLRKDTPTGQVVLFSQSEVETIQWLQEKIKELNII